MDILRNDVSNYAPSKVVNPIHTPASAIPRNHLAAAKPEKFLVTPMQVMQTPHMTTYNISLHQSTFHAPWRYPSAHTHDSWQENARPQALQQDVGERLKAGVRNEEER